MIKIKQAEPKDLDAIYDVEVKAWPEHPATREGLEKRLETFPQGFFVIEKEGKIIGIINSMLIGDQTTIESVEQVDRITDYYDPNGKVLENKIK